MGKLHCDVLPLSFLNKESTIGSESFDMLAQKISYGAVRSVAPLMRSMATIQVPIREAINSAIDEEMAREEKVFLIGMLSVRL